jgi:hypothetical protein
VPIPIIYYFSSGRIQINFPAPPSYLHRSLSEIVSHTHHDYHNSARRYDSASTSETEGLRGIFEVLEVMSELPQAKLQRVETCRLGMVTEIVIFLFLITPPM